MIRFGMYFVCVALLGGVGTCRLLQGEYNVDLGNGYAVEVCNRNHCVIWRPLDAMGGKILADPVYRYGVSGDAVYGECGDGFLCENGYFLAHPSMLEIAQYGSKDALIEALDDLGVPEVEMVSPPARWDSPSVRWQAAILIGLVSVLLAIGLARVWVSCRSARSAARASPE